MSLLHLRAPAKINWYLRVTGRRPDGYHAIESLMQTVSLYDELILSESEGFDLQSNFNIPVESNLVYKAWRALCDALGRERGVRVELRKYIPSAAGLGGGSADAATMLSGLVEFWGLDVPTQRLVDIAATVGSDVPFFIHGGAALVGGRGELVEPAAVTRSYEILLAKPPEGVSAGDAYRGLCGFSENGFSSSRFLDALNNGDLGTVAAMAENSLETPVIAAMPVIGRIRDEMRQNGAAVAMMSGSGSTVFGVFEDMSALDRADSALRASGEGIRTWRVRTVS